MVNGGVGRLSKKYSKPGPVNRPTISIIMTSEDLLLQIDASRVAERKEIDRIRNQSRIDRQKILNKWADENARFQIGDILNSYSLIIRVEKIIGRLGVCDKPFIEYRGIALTKQLKNRADGWITSIYDDNPDRNIVKIK